MKNINDSLLYNNQKITIKNEKKKSFFKKMNHVGKLYTSTCQYNFNYKYNYKDFTINNSLNMSFIKKLICNSNIKKEKLQVWIK